MIIRKIIAGLLKCTPIFIISVLVGTGMLGAALAVALFSAGLSEEARNAVVIPIGVTPTLVLIFLIWKGKLRTLTRKQNIVAGIWVIIASVIAGYIPTLIPTDITELVISTGIVSPILLLILGCASDKVYRTKRQRNISIASGKPFDDTEVKNLARNHELALATTYAFFVAVNVTRMLMHDITPNFSPEASRIIGMNIGATVGLIWFNYSPKQREIREFIADSERMSEGKKDNGSN